MTRKIALTVMTKDDGTMFETMQKHDESREFHTRTKQLDNRQ